MAQSCEVATRWARASSARARRTSADWVRPDDPPPCHPLLSCLTFVLQNRVQWVALDDTDGQVTTLDVARMYVWEITNAIPLADVDETLAWSRRLTYSGAQTGALALLFKIVVLVPIVVALSAGCPSRDGHSDRNPRPSDFDPCPDRRLLLSPESPIERKRPPVDIVEPQAATPRRMG